MPPRDNNPTAARGTRMTARPRATNGRFLPGFLIRERPWITDDEQRRTEERWIVHLAAPRDDDPAPVEWLGLLRRQVSARRIAVVGMVVIAAVFVVLVVWR